MKPICHRQAYEEIRIFSLYDLHVVLRIVNRMQYSSPLVNVIVISSWSLNDPEKELIL